MKLQKQQLEVVRFSQEDVIATSGVYFAEAYEGASSHACNNIAQHLLVNQAYSNEEINYEPGWAITLDMYNNDGSFKHFDFAVSAGSDNHYVGTKNGEIKYDFESDTRFGEFYNEEHWYYLGNDSIYHPCTN